MPVEVLTTTTRDLYADWGRSYYPAGATEIDGVIVRRFPVQKRDRAAFDAVNARLMRGALVSAADERVYIEQMIRVPDLYEFMTREAGDRLYVFIPYLFATTYYGAQVCPERSVVIPCLHDESYARLALYREVLPRVQAPDRPLDQYTWKVMAFGQGFAQDLQQLEVLPGYRKTLSFNGRDVTGFTSFCTADTNIWCDGMGQVACAWYSVGNRERGDFYTRETEKLIIEEMVDGRAYKTIPYAPAHSPGYDWVDTGKGFVSSCAWYILAAKQFNPMRVD